jgi:membrane fusion protein, macrolide-specific efflux system
MPVNIWQHRTLLVNGGLVVVLAGAGVGSYFAIQPSSSGTSVVTTTVARGTVLATVSASGTVEPARNLGLNFTTGGKLTALYVKVGQKVHVGQTLAKVDPTASDQALTMAEAAMASAEAQLSAAIEGETPQAKAAQSASAATSAAQVTAAKTALSQEQQVVAAALAGLEQAVTTAQDVVDEAQSALNTDEQTLATAETQLTSDENKLASDEAAEQAACPPAGSTATPSADCTTLEADVATDKTNVASDESAVSSDQSAVTAAENTVTNDENSYDAAVDSENSGKASENASISADESAVTNAEKSYAAALASNVSSATPNQATIAADEASVTSDAVTIQQDKAAVAGTVLTAPFAGTVASISSSVGEEVSSSSTSSSASSSSSSSSSSSGENPAGVGSGPGTGVGGAGTSSAVSGFIVLTNVSNLLVEAEFDETDAASIQVGAGATVTVNALSSNLSATVAEIDPTATSSSSVVEYGVTLALSQQVKGLKPGQSVSVSVITGEANNALYVPATAVTTADGVSFVEVVGANGAERRALVTLGVQSSTDDQILSGLTEGEKVVASTASSSSSTGFPGGGFPGGGIVRLGGGGGGGGGGRG